MRSVSSRRCPLSARRKLFVSALMGCGFRSWPTLLWVCEFGVAKLITINCPRSFWLFPLPGSSHVWTGHQGFTYVHHDWPDLRRSAYGITLPESGRSVSRLYALGHLFDGLQTLRERLSLNACHLSPVVNCLTLLMLSGCRLPPSEVFSHAPLWRTYSPALKRGGSG